MSSVPYVELDHVSKYFGSVIALKDISFEVHLGKVVCLLGDNGAGKSTLIKTIAGVYQPSEGELKIEGKKILFKSPRDALNNGIATVYQDLALIPMMSISRNFFMGRELTKGRGILQRFAFHEALRISQDKMLEIGIDVRDSNQPVGTLSGGERQCLAIAKAVHFGAKVLILDEPTAALGVHQSGVVLKLVRQSASRGLGVILITHNVHHAYPVADSFVILNRGQSLGRFQKSEVSKDEVLNMMAGGRELKELEHELEGA